MKLIIGITLVSAMGGLLFGYDWVVYWRCQAFLTSAFSTLHSRQTCKGGLMSSSLIGCLFGAMSSGYLSDSFGRKKPLVGAALLFTVSAIGTGIVDLFTPIYYIPPNRWHWHRTGLGHLAHVHCRK